MKQLLLTCIRWYQKYLSLDTGYLKFILHSPGTCRFTPTCSEYTYQAIDHYGIIFGLWLGMKRIIRCHPWSTGGYDPLPKTI